MQYTSAVMAHAPSSRSRRLLAASIAAGPVFYGTAIGQMLTRAGFDITRHPLSLLSLGEAGWIQSVNFIVTGLLVLVGAWAFRQTMVSGPGSAAGPLLVGLFGAGTAFAGLFPPDPAFGFPPGAPPGMPTRMSIHSMLHGIGFDVAFLSLIVATFLFARHYSMLSLPGWRVYSIATGVVTPMLIIAGMAPQPVMDAIYFVAGMLAFGWLSAVAWRQRTATRV